MRPSSFVEHMNIQWQLKGEKIQGIHIKIVCLCLELQLLID